MADVNPTLYINRSDSQCGNCGKGCDPHDQKHVKCLGYGDQPAGCGVEWTHVSSHYAGEDIAGMCRAMRPDLIWVSNPTFVKGQ